MSSQLDEFLATRASLTNRQIERLLLQISLQNATSESESGAKISGVSKGAYYRVLGQAKSNIVESLYTVLLCSRMGVLRMDDLRRLLDMISRVPTDVADVESQQVEQLVEALVKRIVML
jgi:hypothetical protein